MESCCEAVFRLEERLDITNQWNEGTLCMEKQRSSRKGNEQNVPGGKEIFKPMKTGRTDKFEFAFAHKDKLCSPLPKEGPRPLGAL